MTTICDYSDKFLITIFSTSNKGRRKAAPGNEYFNDKFSEFC